MVIVKLTKCISISTGVSSSGAMYKHPGRVGDSPLPGSGLYAGQYHPVTACTGHKVLMDSSLFNLSSKSKLIIKGYRCTVIKVPHPKREGGPVLLLQNYSHPLSLRGRSPYHFPTLLNT